MKNPLTDSNLAIMNQVERTFQTLFVSRMAPGSDFGIVRNIVLVARQRNAVRHVTGALLFDGERFCELIEGAEADVQVLMHNISLDPRHTDVTVLFAGPAPEGRAMQRWVSGYCDASEVDVLAGDTGMRDRPALDAFMSVLRRADVA